MALWMVCAEGGSFFLRKIPLAVEPGMMSRQVEWLWPIRMLSFQYLPASWVESVGNYI